VAKIGGFGGLSPLKSFKASLSLKKKKNIIYIIIKKKMFGA